MQEMLNRSWNLGGENSGHLICLDITNTGDGIVSALQALAALVNCGQPLADACSKMRKFPQSMINVRAVNAADITINKKVQSAVADVESKLGENGRVILRPSGTEPVLRVMVEGEDFKIVERLAQELSAVVAVECGS
jgi:phosphoglucosamine mutase